jgi:hypothetical protein
MTENRKKVFISYSWDNSEHQEWVLSLAKDLMSKFGIEVILDQFELSAGKDLTYFMESSIEKADKVLIILTPNYKIKAEDRKSGVGYETSMITQEIFESSITEVKFIPILRIGDSKNSSPKFLKSKVYHHMIDDNLYVNKLYELSRIIYDKPIIEKPTLGEIPNFTDATLDPILDIAKSLLNEEKLNLELNQIISSIVGTDLFRKEIDILNAQLKEKVELYKNSTGLHFNYESNNRDSTLIQCEEFCVSFYWDLKYSNTAENASLIVRQWKGYLRLDNRAFYFPSEEPKRLKETKYKFDLNYSKEVIWDSLKEKASTTEIIQNTFVFLINEVKKVKTKNFRR